MTESEFIHKLYERYESAGELLEGTGGYNIQRGMAHSISGYLEDLFALFIAKRLNRHDLQFLVDKVVSINLPGNKRSTSFKPDLMISKSVQNQFRMTHYLDLKTNLGWTRDLEEFMLQKEEFINKIKGQYAWVRFGKEVQSVLIEEDIKYHIVVVFGWNINKNVMSSNIELAKKLSNVRLNVLCTKPEGNHKIHQEEFDQLYEYLNI